MLLRIRLFFVVIVILAAMASANAQDAEIP